MLSCVGKLLISILNKRLTHFVQLNGLLSENQAGFRRMRSTLDRTFVLKALIDMFALTKNKLYCAFLDYQRAFDSIWKHALWYNLINHGISWEILQVVINVYNQIQSCVFLDGQIPGFFGSVKGVRQGENLSPLLFSLFLNNLEHFLVDNGCSKLNCD